MSKAASEAKKLEIFLNGSNLDSNPCFNNNSAIGGIEILKVSSMVRPSALIVDVPDLIRLRVTKKVTQGTVHLIFDIDDIQKFWSDNEMDIARSRTSFVFNEPALYTHHLEKFHCIASLQFDWFSFSKLCSRHR